MGNFLKPPESTHHNFSPTNQPTWQHNNFVGLDRKGEGERKKFKNFAWCSFPFSRWHICWCDLAGGLWKCFQTLRWISKVYNRSKGDGKRWTIWWNVMWIEEESRDENHQKLRKKKASDCTMLSIPILGFSHS